MRTTLASLLARWEALPGTRWRLLGLLLIALGTGLSFSATLRKSVTVDEFQALPSGLAMLRTGDLRYPQGTPPWSQLLPALPLLFSDATIHPVEGRNANWAVAHYFAEENSDRFHLCFFLGRAVSALVLALTLWLTFLLARSWYGEPGAVLALACLCFNPTFLAHGSLLTPDIYFACSVMGFLLCFDRYSRAPTPGGAFALGASAAVACLMKLTGLALIACLPAAFFPRRAARSPTAR